MTNDVNGEVHYVVAYQRQLLPRCRQSLETAIPRPKNSVKHAVSWPV